MQQKSRADNLIVNKLGVVFFVSCDLPNILAMKHEMAVNDVFHVSRDFPQQLITHEARTELLLVVCCEM